MNLTPIPTPQNVGFMTLATMETLRAMIQNETTERAGALYWNSNGAAVPTHCFRDAYLEAPAAQAAAVEAYTAAAIAEYRRSYRGPSAEDLVEMRAAFGAGAVVVNVITGKRTKL